MSIDACFTAIAYNFVYPSQEHDTLVANSQLNNLQRQQMTFHKFAQRAAAAGVELTPGWGTKMVPEATRSGVTNVHVLYPDGKCFHRPHEALEALGIVKLPPAIRTFGVTPQQLADAEATAARLSLVVWGSGQQDNHDNAPAAAAGEAYPGTGSKQASSALQLHKVSVRHLSHLQRQHMAFYRLVQRAAAAGVEVGAGWGTQMMPHHSRPGSMEVCLISPRGHKFRDAVDAFRALKISNPPPAPTARHVTRQQLADAEATAVRLSLAILGSNQQQDDDPSAPALHQASSGQAPPAAVPESDPDAIHGASSRKQKRQRLEPPSVEDVMPLQPSSRHKKPRLHSAEVLSPVAGLDKGTGAGVETGYEALRDELHSSDVVAFEKEATAAGELAQLQRHNNELQQQVRDRAARELDLQQKTDALERRAAELEQQLQRQNAAFLKCRSSQAAS